MAFNYLAFWVDEDLKQDCLKEKVFKEEEKKPLISFTLSNKVLIIESKHGHAQRQRENDLKRFFIKQENKILRELKKVN